jgi:hypothetical protein
MRLRVTLRGFVLSCGCVGGAYQTYDERVAHLVDVPAPACTHAHRAGRLLPDTDVLSLLQGPPDNSDPPAPAAPHRGTRRERAND